MVNVALVIIYILGCGVGGAASGTYASKLYIRGNASVRTQFTITVALTAVWCLALPGLFL